MRGFSVVVSSILASSASGMFLAPKSEATILDTDIPFPIPSSQLLDSDFNADADATSTDNSVESTSVVAEVMADGNTVLESGETALLNDTIPDALTIDPNSDISDVIGDNLVIIDESIDESITQDTTSADSIPSVANSTDATISDLGVPPSDSNADILASGADLIASQTFDATVNENSQGTDALLENLANTLPSFIQKSSSSHHHRMSHTVNGKMFVNREAFITKCRKMIESSRSALSPEDMKTMVELQLKSAKIEITSDQKYELEDLVTGKTDVNVQCANFFEKFTTKVKDEQSLIQIGLPPAVTSKMMKHVAKDKNKK